MASIEEPSWQTSACAEGIFSRLKQQGSSNSVVDKYDPMPEEKPAAQHMRCGCSKREQGRKTQRMRNRDLREEHLALLP